MPTATTPPRTAANPSATWSRLAVPTGQWGTVTSGTYFRLGAFSSEETSILPSNKYSRSEVIATEMTPTLSADGAAEYNDPDYGLAETQAVDPTATSKVDNYATSGGGNLITDSGSGTTDSNRTVRNTTRQFEELLLTIKKHSMDPVKYGVLAKTDGDIIANAGGGGIFKFSEGVTIGSVNGDINFDAPTGTFAVACANGVKMTAGSPTNRANIALTAFGYIKQTAYGPLDDVRYSTSSVTTYGWTKEWFYGEKFSEFHGTSTSNFYGVEQKATFAEQRSTAFAASISFTLSTSLAMSVGVKTEIWVGFTLGLSLSGRIDIQAAINLKFNWGLEFKYVSQMDLKLTPIDFKIVGIDGKIAQHKIDAKTFSDFQTQLAKISTSMMKADQKTISCESGAMFGSIKALRNLL